MSTMLKILSETGKEISFSKSATAKINPQKCVNCGTCREVCPTEAIREMQRIICRVCPECTGKPGLSYSAMKNLATEKACTTGCPLGISPQGYLNLVKNEKEKEAYELIWDKNPLPSICARVCHHPCEQSCKRGILVDSPLSIRNVKRYLSDNVYFEMKKYPRIYEERIAIIGAGPAGLTAGHYLAKAGYDVTVFEREAQAGGMLVRGIPEFRLDRKAVVKDIKKLEEAGLHIETGVSLGKNQIEKLKKEYDAIIIATGAPNSKVLPIEGNRMNGIMTAMEFLQQTNHHQEIMHHMAQCYETDGEVVVIGGGSVAVDTARAALRQGASKVTVICLEEGEQIPAHDWEVNEAKEEGVRFIEGVSPIRFCGDIRLNLTGVEVSKVTAFYKDEAGKIRFETEKNKTQLIPAQCVIMAIGQTADEMWKECKTDEILLFAGDVDSSKCSVIDAMASGKEAAYQVIRKFGRHDANVKTYEHKLYEAPIQEKIYPQTKSKVFSPKTPRISTAERLESFKEVEKTWSQEETIQEVSRCLECGYEYVDSDKCIGCGACQRSCPKGDAIMMVSVEGGTK